MPPQFDKIWKKIYEEFKKASKNSDEFFITKEFRYSFLFRYDSKNYEVACNGRHTEDFVRIETYAIELRGGAEVKLPEIKNGKKNIKELETIIMKDEIISMNEEFVPVEEFVRFYINELKNLI